MLRDPTSTSLARIAAALACAFGAAACTAKPAPERIVVISLDTLRNDALARMPRTSARAAQGRTFERYYAATSCTQPTHATLFTGLAPWQHGVSRNGLLLTEKLETLAEKLRARGYSTRAVVASFPLDHEFGFAQGFDLYDDRFDLKMPYRQWDGLQLGDEEFYSLGDHVAEQAIAAIDSAPAGSQFFFFHFFDAHAPYGDTGDGEPWSPGRVLAEIKQGADAGEALRRARAAYDADTEALDRSIERVLERLARDAGSLPTHVFILADHGESFGEDGVVSHGSRVTEEQIRVPLIVLSPRASPGVEKIPVGTVDVAATLLALAGVSELPAGGRDLLAPTLAPAPVAGMRRTYAEPYADARTDGTVVTITGHDFFLVDGERVFTGDGDRVRLNDLPGTEQSGARAEEVARLFANFSRTLSASEAAELSDEKTIETLKRLGYTR